MDILSFSKRLSVVKLALIFHWGIDVNIFLGLYLYAILVSCVKPINVIFRCLIAYMMGDLNQLYQKRYLFWHQLWHTGVPKQLTIVIKSWRLEFWSKSEKSTDFGCMIYKCQDMSFCWTNLCPCRLMIMFIAS